MVVITAGTPHMATIVFTMVSAEIYFTEIDVSQQENWSMIVSIYLKLWQIDKGSMMLIYKCENWALGKWLNMHCHSEGRMKGQGVVVVASHYSLFLKGNGTFVRCKDVCFITSWKLRSCSCSWVIKPWLRTSWVCQFKRVSIQQYFG